MSRAGLELLNAEVIACTRCPRLVAWRTEVAQIKRRAYLDWHYWGRPVPGWGDPDARLIILGLAPGAHGANRTGRPFTGDGSGDFLYAALHRNGFANQPVSRARNDGLMLQDCYVTGVARCVPPQNRPTAGEVENCRSFLARELALLPSARVVMPLGGIAFDGYLKVLRSQGREIPRLRFSHGARYVLAPDLPIVLPCYHVSRQNTNTGRLTPAMIDDVFARVRSELHG